MMAGLADNTRKHQDTGCPEPIGRQLRTMYGERAAEAWAFLQPVLEKRLMQLRSAGRIRQAGTVRTGQTGQTGQTATDSVPAREHAPPGGRKTFGSTDALLIAYGDMLADPGSGVTPLARLGNFLERRVPGLFSYVHILPFFPYSSDDGFSVMDYRVVDPALGSWDDVTRLGAGRSLAFDLVLNHASAKSAWFAGFLAGKEPWRRFFITRPVDYDSGTVLRPRTHPLITPVRLDDGSTVGVWTTFSADQVDLNFAEPVVLSEFVDILLEYAVRGAGLVRLDAIAYLWKRDGTSCAHLQETHAAVKLLRAVVDHLGVDLVILTETNVPHEENMSYFGDGDEAHMVYNFSLPPLVLHAFVTGDVSCLSDWARALKVPDGGTMLNFLASHDGVGVTPARSWIPDLSPVLQAVTDRGGLVSYKASPDGPVPYELNISWADAVSPVNADDITRANALVASYAIACAMDGVPAVYFHSLVGSRSWRDGPKVLGYNRAINRERPLLEALEAELDDNESMRSVTLRGMSALLANRGNFPAFAPDTARVVHSTGGPVFAVERGDGAAAVLVLVNCSDAGVSFRLPVPWHGRYLALDPRTDRATVAGRGESVSIAPYGVLWLKRTV